MNKGVLRLILLLGLSQGVSAESEEGMDYARLSCNELYLLASQVEPKTQRHRSPLFNEKTDVIATAIGSVTTVGYYYFGFSTAREYFEDYRSHHHRMDLDRIRQHMAQQYCFQKF
jgi:hypothetical protein